MGVRIVYFLSKFKIRDRLNKTTTKKTQRESRESICFVTDDERALQADLTTHERTEATNRAQVTRADHLLVSHL